MNTKICTKCKRELPATTEYFHRDKSRVGGLFPWCSECVRKDKCARYRKQGNPRRKGKGWLQAVNTHLYRHGCKMCAECGKLLDLSEYTTDPKGQFKLKSICNECRAKQRAHRPNSQRSQFKLKDKGLKQCCVCGEIKPISDFYRRKNRLAYQCKNCKKENQKEYETYLRKTNATYKMTGLLRHRISEAFKRKGIIKSLRTEILLGCDISKAYTHFKTTFKNGMTEEIFLNTNRIHIDHIIPCASFNLTDPKQQKRCFHYTNLQALWAKENMEKGAKKRKKKNN